MQSGSMPTYLTVASLSPLYSISSNPHKNSGVQPPLPTLHMWGYKASSNLPAYKLSVQGLGPGFSKKAEKNKKNVRILF